MPQSTVAGPSQAYRLIDLVDLRPLWVQDDYAPLGYCPGCGCQVKRKSQLWSWTPAGVRTIDFGCRKCNLRTYLIIFPDSYLGASLHLESYTTAGKLSPIQQTRMGLARSLANPQTERLRCRVCRSQLCVPRDWPVTASDRDWLNQLVQASGSYELKLLGHPVSDPQLVRQIPVPVFCSGCRWLFMCPKGRTYQPGFYWETPWANNEAGFRRAVQSVY